MVHNRNVLTSYELVLGSFQLGMAEDIKKPAFRALSSGLYKFTSIPLAFQMWVPVPAGLYSILLAIKFGTSLMYLDDILIFAPDISAMINQTELVFT